MKKAAIFLTAALIFFSFGGCQGPQEDYDVTGYIEGVISDSYAGTEKTGGTESSNSSTTVENAAIRFFEKYKMNPSEQQQSDMADVFRKAYQNSKYTVGDKTKASYGFDVVVDFEIQTTMADLSADITAKRSEAEQMGIELETGAEYIDSIITMCSNAMDAPTYSGSDSITFDIKLDENQSLSLNIKLFDKLDEAILPL